MGLYDRTCGNAGDRSRVGLPGRATSEDQMENSEWRRGSFDFEASFESF